jgi:hypothetical protein
MTPVAALTFAVVVFTAGAVGETAGAIASGADGLRFGARGAPARILEVGASETGAEGLVGTSVFMLVFAYCACPMAVPSELIWMTTMRGLSGAANPSAVRTWLTVAAGIGVTVRRFSRGSGVGAGAGVAHRTGPESAGVEGAGVDGVCAEPSAKRAIDAAMNRMMDFIGFWVGF